MKRRGGKSDYEFDTVATKGRAKAKHMSELLTSLFS